MVCLIRLPTRSQTRSSGEVVACADDSKERGIVAGQGENGQTTVASRLQSSLAIV